MNKQINHMQFKNKLNHLPGKNPNKRYNRSTNGKSSEKFNWFGNKMEYFLVCSKWTMFMTIIAPNQIIKQIKLLIYI